MNNTLWQVYLSQLEHNNASWLRDKLKDSLQNKIGGVEIKGFSNAGQFDLSGYFIDEFFDELSGSLKEVIESITIMTDLTDEEKQERKLFELGMDFLDSANHGAVSHGKEYIDAGLDVNFRDPVTLKTALHVAAHTCTEFVRILVNTGECDYLAQTKEGEMPFERVQFENRSVYRLLFRKACQQAKAEGYPSLMDYMHANPSEQHLKEIQAEGFDNMVDYLKAHNAYD